MSKKPFYPGLAVVTGAGSGIGRGTAKALAALGAEVIVADIDLDSAKDAAAEINSRRGTAFAYRLDVADTPALEAFAAQVKATHGVPDVVVNNAGILVGGPLIDVPLRDFQRITDINLMAMIHGCRVFGAQMVERGRGGHLVNVASMAAFAAAPYTGPYSIGKYAVKHFSDCLRAEFAQHRIGVTAICPGLIATNLSNSMKADGILDAEQSELTRKLMLKGQALFGMHPDKAGQLIVRAVRENRAVEPIRPEARIAYPLTRFAPGLVRFVMTQAGKRDITRLRDTVAGPQAIARVERLVDRIPFRSGNGTDSADGTLNTKVGGAV
ncbi:SDR family NAD(P)-dependent oxidoreductase [Nocardia sp. 2]|uniref:SDR family NAD(P)-dependent oxidoreductase n=1 Tax=Nocardia acididurans TaxID=2802282 RepID=A0ABS1M8A4_9NOCA|nr:SDR family NAD(P)-dependent oxidoreductase [Nocardia acididurans]MBL1075383.1 SDR family NAD(P)-dependent oxidoreductase [Nocardia acididurans]